MKIATVCFREPARMPDGVDQSFVRFNNAQARFEARQEQGMVFISWKPGARHVEVGPKKDHGEPVYAVGVPLSNVKFIEYGDAPAPEPAKPSVQKVK